MLEMRQGAVDVGQGKGAMRMIHKKIVMEHDKKIAGDE